jgi:hypothetical protein
MLKICFLNVIFEEVYVKQRLGFEDIENLKHNFKRKFIVRSEEKKPRAWSYRLHNILLNFLDDKLTLHYLESH